MIGKIDIEKSLLNAPNDRSLFVAVASVVNSLVDAVNVLQESMDLVQSTLVAEPDTHAENAPAPITLIDIFNEMGRLYADLWNKMEDIHYDLKTKGGDNE